MRENRTCGSEGGEAQSLPYPYPGGQRWRAGELKWLVGAFNDERCRAGFYTAGETPAFVRP